MEEPNASIFTARWTQDVLITQHAMYTAN